MPSPLDRQNNDIAVHWVPPQGIADPRVPTTEELNHHQLMVLNAQINDRERSWSRPPTLTINQPRSLEINGVALLPEAPAHRIAINTVITLAALPTGAGMIQRQDHVSLVSFVAVVGAEQDIALGEMTFQYLQGEGENATLQTVTKENTRRYRHFWAIVVGDSPITPEEFVSLLGEGAIEGDRTLAVVNVSGTGFALGNYTVYARGGLSQGATYKVETDFIGVLSICSVNRQKNFTERGFTWGVNGEDALDSDFVIVRERTKVDFHERLLQIFSGQPGPGSSYRRAVQNLVAGSVPGNSGREGESTNCPNGSTALANDQRLLFINDRDIQTLGATLVTATNDGNGRPVVTIGLNTQVPLGTVFSQVAADHKIIALNGEEQQDLGQFINLGGSGSLTWVGDSNTSIAPGQQVFFVPGIVFPSGSGFSIPFESVELAWLNGAEILAENILKGGTEDIETYTDPAENQEYMVVVAPDRAGLLYIYRKYQVVSNSAGIASAPADARGCFAFIQGVQGRLDTPVVTGLSPNTTYNALVYYTPKSLESWQFQLKYCAYQGTKESVFLDGSRVASNPICYIHTQGGGGRVFQSDASIRFVPVGMHLPGITSGSKIYDMSLPCLTPGEQGVGNIRFRPITVLSGGGLSLPTPGQHISVESLSGTHTRSLSVRLKANGELMGFRAPLLANGGLYQIVLAFLVEKEGQQRLVMATHVSQGNKNVILDTSLSVAIDTFLI